MRPVERFLSMIDGPEGKAAEDRLIRQFVSLTAPVIGAAGAEDLCAATLDGPPVKSRSRYRRLGFIAAFLLGDFDDDSMELDDEDWVNIRETLEDASTGMDLETLTSLMGELLSRGRLG